jgi:hypothetical protein
MEERLRGSIKHIYANLLRVMHFCQICVTKENFMEITLPYFNAGSENYDSY